MENKKFLVLLQEQNASALKKVEREFKVSLTSSEELSSTNKSYDIINANNGVVYKNLGVAVMDEVDMDQLKSAVNNDRSPVIYFEEERDFFAVNEMNLINDLKVKAAELSSMIAELENFLIKKPLVQEALTEMEWGLKAIGIDRAQFTGKGIDLCVLDTGLDLAHPDFADRNIVGKSFVPDEVWEKDPYGHGTHCAGTAAGNVRSDTGKRYGIAKDCNLKIGKVLSNKGKGTTSGIIDAIDWALEHKFRIISMSLASPVKLNEKPSAIFEAVGRKAMENNCLLIAAAGNDSKRPAVPAPVASPANCGSIMSVAAIDSQMRIANFSNGGINSAHGGNINVCAPGVDILSARPVKEGANSLYTLMKGTSMAAPHVAGLAALYMEKFPDLRADKIWDLLESTAKAIQNLKYRDIGSGLVQFVP